MDYLKFSDLVGKVMISVANDNDERIVFKTEDEEFILAHDQDCCESVMIEDICGDLNDLVGTPILMAEEASSSDDPDDVVKAKSEAKAKNLDEYAYVADSQTWTFYKLRTIKGSVDIRWYGSSNGYYSEDVSFSKVA